MEKILVLCVLLVILRLVPFTWQNSAIQKKEWIITFVVFYLLGWVVQAGGFSQSDEFYKGLANALLFLN
ncbi:hypothetical protein [Parachlamydia acanthamoebae]|jgi:hypothetical protein|uniref:Uncharacterized protein n=2 Tax=Parachlamydia acanthamoebae TaxID=83552 RepID=F8KXA7_PARAV|nr:hypothetical protein [Parachlamydia acanthamoebae]EFB41381.1 hypothetical protein pah_c045o094 [Parachlamydia acanthamoebae str. Hall's coccus]KIA78663.1 hypothetical protein DB43_DP00200 [Parachlamydia acanthamoebae]CCB85579.1 putative uncharacterized protein [Parachlamydia acanthamoebae UV-7]